MQLEKIIELSANFYSYRKFDDFAIDIITYIFDVKSILNQDESVKNGFISMNVDNTDFIIYSAMGKYIKHIDKKIDAALSNDLLSLIEGLQLKKMYFHEEDNKVFHYFNSNTDIKYIIFLESNEDLDQNQVSLLKLLFYTISSAFNNLCLSNDIVSTQSELLITLGQVVETRSKETGNHVRRVAEYSKLLASKYGLNEDEVELLKQASPMHDIGKVGVLDEILNKPGSLSKEEFDVMRKHTQIGYEIFKKSKRRILKAASIISLEHHEKWDGTGYPKGLKREQIHIFGRITSIADVFDAIGSDRVYKKAWPVTEVIKYIESEKGRAFDPRLVNLFLDNLDEILAIREKLKD